MTSSMHYPPNQGPLHTDAPPVENEGGNLPGVKPSTAPPTGKKRGTPKGFVHKAVICEVCGRAIGRNNIKRHQGSSKCVRPGDPVTKRDHQNPKSRRGPNGKQYRKVTCRHCNHRFPSNVIGKHEKACQERSPEEREARWVAITRKRGKPYPSRPQRAEKAPEGRLEVTPTEASVAPVWTDVNDPEKVVPMMDDNIVVMVQLAFPNGISTADFQKLKDVLQWINLMQRVVHSAPDLS